MKNLSNEELMRLYALNNEAAFEEIYSRFSGRLYGYFISKLRSEDSAKDLLQDCFKQIHLNRTKYDPKFKVESWFFTIAHNLLVSFYRRKEKKNVELKENMKFETKSDDKDFYIDLKKLETAISNLPETERKIINDRFFNERNYEELAKEFGKTEVNLRKIISRTLEKLRGILKNET